MRTQGDPGAPRSGAPRGHRRPGKDSKTQFIDWMRSLIMIRPEKAKAGVRGDQVTVEAIQRSQGNHVSTLEQQRQARSRHFRATENGCKAQGPRPLSPKIDET